MGLDVYLSAEGEEVYFHFIYLFFLHPIFYSLLLSFGV